MKCCLTIIFSFFLLLSAKAQNTGGRKISKDDSVLLVSFWNKFKNAVDKKDKRGLEEIFTFPFYCSQCLNYVKATDSYGATVKVTRKKFQDSVFKLFYDLPGLNKENATEWKEGFIFMPMKEIYNREGFMIAYTIFSGSENWEGLQGFIYLKKIRGRYLITSLDTVP